MKIGQLWIGALLFCVSFSSILAADQRADVDRMIQPYVNDGRIVGLAVGMVDSGGIKFFSYGTIAKDSDQEIDESTLFEIGSITKVFTALILADMAQKGEIGLDDTLDQFLPNKVPAPNRHGKKITLQHLATHTSGLPRLPSNLNVFNLIDPYAQYDDMALQEYLSNAILVGDPGDQWIYSNLGVGLLGNLFARHAERSYEELVVERICKPLGMSSTVQTLTPDLKKKLAAGHAGGEAVSNWNFQALAGCGALRSNAQDMLKFVSAHLGLGNSVITPAIRTALQVRRPTTDSALTQLLGWLSMNTHGDEIIFHNGQTGGYHSFVGFRPSTQTGIVLLCNSAFNIDPIGMHLLDNRHELPATHQQVHVDPKIYDDYAGRYQLAPGVLFVVERAGDQLMAQLTGQDRYEIYPESETKFFYKVVDAQVTFERNNEGKVHRLILHQNGRDQIANRLESEAEPTEIKIDAQLLDSYVGTYKHELSMVFTVTREKDQLWVQLAGQPKIEVYPKTETRFFYKVVVAEIEFHKEKDQVSALTLFQNGQKIFARKTP